MRPDCLVAGEISRLIPAVSETNKEIRLLSPVLATLRVVPEYARTVLGPLGVKLGTRSRIECFSEIVFKGADFKHDRPDGLIMIDTGRSQWRAIIEAKHGKNQLKSDQIERYLELAKSCDVDAVITISNQITASPLHSPVEISPKLIKRVNLFHIAWSQLRTSVDLLMGSGEIIDAERQVILAELQRYLQHQSSGIEGFTQMNSGWRDLTARLRAGEKVPASDINIIATASDWIEEQKDLCLLLSREIQASVTLKLPRAHLDSQDAWRNDIAKLLSNEARMSAQIIVPDAAAPIDIDTRIAGRVFIASMKLRAPADRKSTSARVNWAIRQLNKTEDSRVQLEVHWPGSKDSRRIALADFRADPETLKSLDQGPVCNHVSVLLVEELAGSFSGNRKFIDAIESALSDFYQLIGQHMRAWQAPAPRSHRADNDDVEHEVEEDLSKASGDGKYVDIPDHLL